MTNKAKHLLKSILLASTSIIYLFLVYIGYQKQSIDLLRYDHYENIVIDRGICIRCGSSGRQTNVFYLALTGLDEKSGIYRMSRNYDDLLEIVRMGDVLKVYYKSNKNTKENVNVDLIQVEKDREILIHKYEY